MLLHLLRLRTVACYLYPALAISGFRGMGFDLAARGRTQPITGIKQAVTSGPLELAQGQTKLDGRDTRLVLQSCAFFSIEITQKETFIFFCIYTETVTKAKGIEAWQRFLLC